MRPYCDCYTPFRDFFKYFLHYFTISFNACYLIIYYASEDPGTDGNGSGQMIMLRHPKSGNLKNIHYIMYFS